MRRLVSLAVLLFFAVPFGISLSGCSKGVSVTYCNGTNAGLQVGQLAKIVFTPAVTGISLNLGQIGGSGSVSGTDCKGTSVSTTGVVYGVSTSLVAQPAGANLLDVEPSNGRLCAGSWNRNSGGNIADFTFCTAGTASGTAYITATSQGVVSNPVPVFVHPQVTSIQLVKPTSSCLAPAPGQPDTRDSSCYTLTTLGACVNTAGSPIAASTALYDGSFCVSQNHSAQLAAQVFAGTTNISCSVGPLTFAPQNGNIVTVDGTGLATAAAPGSTLINTTIAQSSSSIGFFSTCPPASITLTTAGSTTAPTGPVSIAQNTTQSLVATVLDSNNNPITSIPLNYVSTSPTTVPANGAAITPTFPGAATITAVCQPSVGLAVGNCNPSAFNQIGLFGNGLQVTSNPVIINATGTAPSTILYIASTQSLYVQPVDFTLNTQPSAVRLPYAPNSMVLSQDLSSIYLGTTNELMVLSVSQTSTTLARQDIQVSGNALALSPDGATLVISDPIRKIIYLYNTGGSGSVATQYGGNATRAAWSPDSQTVYITTDDGRLLVHSSFIGWAPVTLPNAPNTSATDVTLTIPNSGVYLANGPAAPANGTASPVTARTDCPVTTQVTPAAPAAPNFNTTTTNVFYPQADVSAGSFATRVAATNDGTHILGASPTNFLDLTTNAKSGACGSATRAFTSNQAAYPPLAGITVTPSTTLTGIASATGSGIVSVLPTSDSAFAFVIYTGTGGVVPQFNPATLALTNIPLQSTASGVPLAPVSGVVSADNNTLFVGTTGDNVVHRLTRGTTGFTDTLAPTIPALVNINGGTTPATPDLLVQRPRRSTN